MSIKIDLKIFLFLFLFLLTSQLEIYLLLMALAILHELGHVIAGIILKFKPEEIKLTPVGLQISFRVLNYIEINEGDNINTTKAFYIKKAIIALAGPLTNLIIAAITIVISIVYTEFSNTYLYYLLLYSNLLIALFNLLPIYPMDGGRILKEILNLAIGKKKAGNAIYIISKTVLIALTAFASILILYIHNIAIIVILAYLWYLEIVEMRRYRQWLL